MAAGIRTINGYTNNYPIVTNTTGTLGTLSWETYYRVSTTATTLSFTIPAFTEDAQHEIRIWVWMPSGLATLSVNSSNYSLTYGFQDLDLIGAQFFEISLVPYDANSITIIAKKWL